MDRLGWTCLLALAPVVLVGCGGGGSEGGGDGDGTGTTADLSAYEGPIASNDTATGEQLYNDICMACHASSNPLPNLGLTPAAMRHQIREGGGGMPAIGSGQLSDDQMEAVLAFMVTNGAVIGEAGGGAEPTGGGEEPLDDSASGEDETPL